MTAARTSAVGSVEFAFARVWARQSRRPGEPEWRRIETQRSLAQALEAARACALRPWLDGITRDSDGHAIEATLRRRWPGIVAETATWMPAVWQPAVHWCSVWPDLPRLQHLARGHPAPAWLGDEPGWPDVLARRHEPDALRDSPWTPLSPAWRAPGGDADAWADAWSREWARRLPPHALTRDRPLAGWLTLMRRHRQGFAAAPVHEAWPQRAVLATRLRALLRQAAVDPAAAFVHLALQALDLERLRAELLRRVFFPQWASA